MNNEKQEVLISWIDSNNAGIRKVYDDHVTASKARLKSDTWLWDALLLSMATYGSSAGAERLHSKPRPELAYGELVRRTVDQRKAVIEKHYREINGRYLGRKIECLSQAIDVFERSGGLSAFQNKIRSLGSADEKIQALLQLKGIGEKYARNIWMDVGDEHVINSIAIDSRIMKLLNALGLQGLTYKDQERELLKLAAICGINGWMLDRLLYAGLAKGGELERLISS